MEKFSYKNNQFTYPLIYLDLPYLKTAIHRACFICCPCFLCVRWTRIYSEQIFSVPK